MVTSLSLPLFPIPISVYNFGEDNHKLNIDLVTDIFKERDRDPNGSIQSNYGGWHSNPSLEERYKSFSVLRKQIEDSSNDYCAKHGYETGLIVEGLWANMNQSGDMNVGHHHGVSALTGVYYPVESIVGKDCKFSYTESNPVKPGIYDGKNGGSVYFQDPSYGLKCRLRRAKKRNAFTSDQYYTYPVAGVLLIFPSYLIHAVLPFRDKQTKRLSISFTAVYGGER
tara:strand:- start:1109 stop:1783 length:675 start_codon:yes stop_codon:yes gene_type:complete